MDADFQSNSEFINLYPNPNNGIFTIDLELALPEEKNTYSIFGMNGDRIYEETVTGLDYTKQFNLSEMKSGTYILMITSGKSNYSYEKVYQEC
ncbi:MAG: T9SS type A sorting domain-containing protein [Bacteroidales bacterium]|nr:T9SS type A sorting domain-containing protein [Bacteroidales bacterium]